MIARVSVSTALVLPSHQLVVSGMYRRGNGARSSVHGGGARLADRMSTMPGRAHARGKRGAGANGEHDHGAPCPTPNKDRSTQAKSENESKTLTGTTVLHLYFYRFGSRSVRVKFYYKFCE